jgi:hypothetical protein
MLSILQECLDEPGWHILNTYTEHSHLIRDTKKQYF